MPYRTTSDHRLAAPTQAAGAGATRFERVKVTPAYRVVSEAVEARIVSGELAPDTLLPTELELAQQFGVNRSTIRESIRLLEQEGLIERRGSKRLYVTMPGVYDAAPRAARCLLLHGITFEELWQVALALEPEATRLAALKASADEIALLHHTLDRLVQHHAAAGSIEDHAELDIEFHARVAQISGNRALMLAREPINLLYRPSLIQLHQVLPQMERRNVDAHRHIVDAIAHHDGDGARHWMHKHLIDFQRGYALAAIPMNTVLRGVPL